MPPGPYKQCTTPTRRRCQVSSIFAKRKQLGITLTKMYLDESKKSPWATNVAILKPIWTYRIQLWGMASTYTIESFVHDNWCTLVHAEYGYLEGSPNNNSERRILSLQLSIQCLPQCTPKWPSSEPHGATQQQQVIVKIPAKWSAYQIPSVIVVFSVSL
jgi:hypothetical protein